MKDKEYLEYLIKLKKNYIEWIIVVEYMGILSGNCANYSYTEI